MLRGLIVLTVNDKREEGGKSVQAHQPDQPLRHRCLRSEDLFQLRLINEAQISPDGTRVCFVQKVFVPEENKYRSHLWIVPAIGGSSEPFTVGGQLDYAPSWSPNGRWIAFLSTRSKSVQIWVIPTDGGEARKVTSFKGIFGRPVWAPDGRQIAFTILLDKKGIEPEEEEPQTLSPRERFTADVQRITTLPFKENGVGFIGKKFDQIAVINSRE